MNALQRLGYANTIGYLCKSATTGDPSTAGLLSLLPGIGSAAAGIYSGAKHESLNAGLRTGGRSFVEGQLGGLLGTLGPLGLAMALKSKHPSIMAKGSPPMRGLFSNLLSKLLYGSVPLGGITGASIGGAHGAQASMKNLNRERGGAWAQLTR